MATPSSAQLAWTVAAKHEPKIRAAVEAALTAFKGTTKQGVVEAYVIAGDLRGLMDYLDLNLAKAAAPMVAALDAAVTEAGVKTAADVNAALAASGVTLADQIPFPTDTPAAIVFQGVTPEFAYNPVNPKTIAATRTWQGNLIRQMAENARLVVMDHVREGLVRGDNPRTVARQIRADLGLTASQNLKVKAYAAELDGIATNGLRSAQSWGLYTPRQIQALKASDPGLYHRLNFTAEEKAQGRRWGKISRAAGTLQFDPKTGIKPSKPLGFVAPPGTQGGENAYRLTRDGKLVDNMTSWRLRNKQLDPLIYRVVAAEEALSDARAAQAGARTAAEKTATDKALAKATAARGEALLGVDKAKATMVDAYRSRWLKHRSQTIARTESLRAANLGAYESWRQAMDDSGLFEPDEMKRILITARDDRVRDSHRSVAGQTVALNEPFKVDGGLHMIPPFGPNCRCTVGMVVNLGGGA